MFEKIIPKYLKNETIIIVSQTNCSVRVVYVMQKKEKVNSEEVWVQRFYESDNLVEEITK